MTVEIPDVPVGGVKRDVASNRVDNSELVAAIRAHRQAVGVAYGIGSFKAQSEANRILWELVSDDAMWPEVEPDGDGVEAGLVRPAMMEDTE